MSGCIRDTVEADRGLGSRAERMRCFGLEFVRNIFCPEIPPIEALGQNEIAPGISSSKKNEPALTQEISVFREPEHPKKHVTLR